MNAEKRSRELKVGDVIVAKQGGRHFTITGIDAGCLGRDFPYLTLQCDGRRMGHDTSLDSPRATYTVFTPDPLATCAECLEEFEADELTGGVCDECRKEECPACDGTGYSDEYDDEVGASDCEECGGDGVI